MNLIQRLFQVFEEQSGKDALICDGTHYSYKDLMRMVAAIRADLRQPRYAGQQIFGLWITDDLPCYAAIMALWFEGLAYVPLSPEAPYDRNMDIIGQAGLATILSATDAGPYAACQHLHTASAFQRFPIPDADIYVPPVAAGADTLQYILFTSGTTGSPKGVPVQRYNLEAFLVACESLEMDINPNDRCLQMFNMTFDMSVMSYLLCFLNGASLYPIPNHKIKYQYVFELLESHQLTIAFMVPSILHYLRPYFPEIDLPYLRYNLFAGEALPLDVTDEWSLSVPNATIINAYGPTEHTIVCIAYTFKRDGVDKAHNGILAIGQPMKGNEVVIVDESLNLLPAGEAGQLCLSGPQLTPGYWKNEARNAEAFFEKIYKGQPTRFYKSGDLCRMDADGDIFYSGRIDFQAKIQGFRVELSEIEFHCKAFYNNVNLICVAFPNSIGNTEIGLVIESEEGDTKELLSYLKTKMPAYMLPTRIAFNRAFPVNPAGKTDRKLLEKSFMQ